MRPDWQDLFEETQSSEPTRESRLIERSILLGALTAIVLGVLLFSCRARGQDAPVMLGVEIQYDPPSTNTQVLHRSAVRPVVIPPLSSPMPILQPVTSRVIVTNGSKRVTITEQDISPAPLIQDKPRTNAFWVICPHCSVRAIRAPINIQTNGIVTVPDGDQIERTIYFRCCSTEFKARNFKFVETPIAEEVTLKEPFRNTQ